MTEEYPPELDEYRPSYDTAEARVAVSGTPYPTWSWETAPTVGAVPRFVRSWSRAEASSSAGERRALNAEVAGPIPASPATPGIVLHGDAGTGKTGIACCVVRDAAVAAVGPRGRWVLVDSPRIRAAVESGDFRQRPAPAMFYRWRDLKSLLDRAKVDRLPWEESPPLSAEKILREIEDRCFVLALDDVDVDALSPWKEEVLLRLLDMPARGRRLVVTLNVDPTGPEGLARLGERVADRMSDKLLFARFHLRGESLRRRK